MRPAIDRNTRNVPVEVEQFAREHAAYEYIELLWSGGRPELLTNAGAPSVAVSGVKHNVYQWDAIYDNGDFYKGGWAGQGFIVNPQRDLVAVFVSYKKIDESEIRIARALRTVLDSVFGGTAD